MQTNRKGLLEKEGRLKEIRKKIPRENNKKSWGGKVAEAEGPEEGDLERLKRMHLVGTRGGHFLHGMSERLGRRPYEGRGRNQVWGAKQVREKERGDADLNGWLKKN